MIRSNQLIHCRIPYSILITALITKERIFDVLITEFNAFGIFVIVISHIAKPTQIAQIGFIASIRLIKDYSF